MKNSNNFLKIALTLLFGSFLSAGFSQTKNNFTIKGSVKGMDNMPTKIFLTYPDYFHLPKDSAIVKNGTYEFSGYTDEVTQGQLSTSAAQVQIAAITFMLAPGEIDVVSNGTFDNVTFSGPGAGPSTELSALLSKGRERVKAIQKNTATERYKTDSKFKDSISNQIMGVLGSSLADMYNHIRQNPESPISPSLTYLLVGSGFMTGKAADTLIKFFPKSAINGRIHQAMLDGIDARIKKAQDAVLARQMASDKKVPVGSNALDFTANDTEGKAISLSSFKGKYVLLDFWASWCVPCRQENPNVKKAYETYKGKGFTVLGFSLDVPSQKAAWLAAIKSDGLTWTQISDLKGFKGEIATKYVIDAIPQNFLIDPTGKIVAKNLRGEELEKTLAAIFKK